jgi:hypothetical protein
MHPPVNRRHPTIALEMVGTNRGILLWSLWSRTKPLGRNSYTIYSGVDAFRLTRAGRWARATGWPRHQPVEDPIFTGRKVLVAPTGIWCGACSPPFDSNEHGYAVDPQTLHRNQLPHGPLDDTHPQILWTGRSELTLNFDTETSGPGGRIEPGDIAAWNPLTRRWTRGPRAPRALGDAPALWNGKRLLVMAQDGHLLAYTP